jgi:hypothetical protein
MAAAVVVGVEDILSIFHDSLLVTGPTPYALGPQIKDIAAVYKASFLALGI